VLVVEDEPAIMTATLVRLRVAGYATLSACDGEEGVRLAEEHLPDAIVMDVRMPKMDGLTALRQLKVQETTRHVPVIMVSGSLPQKQASLEAGARFYLMKPCQPGELLSAVRLALSEMGKLEQCTATCS
jgi:two-component system response regulator MprA